MSLQLPILNHLCRRWTLPPYFRDQCDLYFLRNFEDAELQKVVQLDAEGIPGIQEYGIKFTVLFMNDAGTVFQASKEAPAEPNNIRYWCSFRSITFEWNGQPCTKSFALVQVDRKAAAPMKYKEFCALKSAGDYLGIISDRAEPRSDAAQTREEEQFRQLQKVLRHGENYGMGIPRQFETFAERSQPTEKDNENEGEAE